MAIRSINPATEEVVAEYAPFDDATIEMTLDRASGAFRRYRDVPYVERAANLISAAEILDSRSAEFGMLLTEEMGKTLRAAIAEVEKCAGLCRYYAEHGEEFLADRYIGTEAEQSFVRHLPLGPVLAVMPWNFPFWQVFRFAIPALMAGNVALLKHASNVPRSALAIERIFADAGFPEGVFQTLLIGSEPVEQLVGDERVKAVTLTGSEAAGSAVAAAAGKHIKKSVLELGGSDAFIVMPTADLDVVVEAAVGARIINNGQSCIAAKRFFVHTDIYERFTTAFVDAFGVLEVGDPVHDTTDVGPLAMAKTREDLDRQIERSIEQGARRLCGAEPISGLGFYYRPGILTDIPPGTPAFTEEVFGPVALLFRVPDLDEAIRLANSSRYGLGSSIWTGDRGEMEKAMNRLEAGSTFVNAIVASDPRLPFGGVKCSGFGRELSDVGIREFVNQKTISVATSA